MRAIFKINNRLSKCKVNVTSNSSRDIDRNNSSNYNKPVAAVKLSKLSIQKFYGDPGTFLIFSVALKTLLIKIIL